ncbi:hypothetical protein CK203_115275 [Vitis vinifera]|uniref:Uncharacterized protein n=1 Tax=Vitis vinifera TaxID=29760 RepID=A0A438C518_VITVI|nr:hypothetical protein CK203_115275 [Vitis vinifera]
MSCAICQSFEHLVEECPILPTAREMFGMPCGICQSFEHLVEECPIIPVAREIFGDYNTYNSNCRNHPNFFWEPQPRQYMQPAQAPHQALKLEQAIVNLTKVVEDFVAHLKSIIDQFRQDNAQVRQETDSQDKKMDEVQNDLSQKIDNLQDSISRLINLNTEREKKTLLLNLIKIKSESIASNGARFGVETKKLWPFEDDYAKLNGNIAAAPISLLLDTFFEHFLELKLCIPYVVFNIRKSGVQCFKRPEEAMPQLPIAVREPRAPWDHTHEASHSISDLLKPSKPIAPTESSN